MTSGKNVIEIINGDITKLKVDAIVNAANESLSAGGGVCGAIHHAAGSELEKECLSLNGCKTGQAKITKGYHLPAKYIIHAVGPVWHGGKNHEAELLTSCYRHSLQLALQHHIKTIAFPAISCGIFGYPIEQAATIAIITIRNFLQKNDFFEKIILCCFSDDIYQTYKEILTNP